MCLRSPPPTHFAPHALTVRPGTHLATCTRQEDVDGTQGDACWSFHGAHQALDKQGPIALLDLGGDVPVPCARLLALGDASLRRKDIEAAIRFYELEDADRKRWARVVDLLSARPEIGR